MTLSFFLLFISFVTVSSDNLLLPQFSSSQDNACVFSEVDPKTVVSREAFQPRGMVDDCESLCASETLFACIAYTFGGPGTHCILHGAISRNHSTAIGMLTRAPGSVYNLTDYECKKGMTNGTTKFVLCGFESRLVEVAAPAGVSLVNAKSLAECQQKCEAVTKPPCSSFGFDANQTAIDAKNCFMFQRSSEITGMAIGTYAFREDRCRIKKKASCISG